MRLLEELSGTQLRLFKPSQKCQQQFHIHTNSDGVFPDVSVLTHSARDTDHSFRVPLAAENILNSFCERQIQKVVSRPHTARLDVHL